MSHVTTPSAAWAFARAKEIRGAVQPSELERAASHLACQRAVNALWGSAARVSLLSRPGRAPLAWVATGGATHHANVSISHRGGVGAAIVSRNADAVGIDVEHCDAVKPEQQRLFLSPRERNEVTTVSPTTLWSMKEAAWKALQLDMTVAFHELQLGFDNGRLATVTFRGARRFASALISDVTPGFVVVAVQLRSHS